MVEDTQASGNAKLDSEGDRTVAQDAPATRHDPIAVRGEDGPVRIGRYVLLRLLGSGGMGVVYSAFDEELNRKVAIKFLYGEEQDDDARSRLRREAQALAQLSHPNVVQVYEVGEYEDRIFLAMEFVGGASLRRWLAETSRTPAEVVGVMGDVAEGLNAAHEAGLVHRDVKPDNILVERNGRVRILDFGLARAGGDEAHPIRPRSGVFPVLSDHSALTEAITAHDTVMGTPAYMAPEQHTGKPVDPRSDQFGFCVTLYEALYAQRPFRAASRDQALLRMKKGDVATPPKDTNVPRWLQRLVYRGLAWNPEDRWPSMRALLDELRLERGQTRRRLTFAGALVLFAGAGGYAVAVSGAAADRCVDDPALLDGAWGTTERAAARNGILQSGLSFAEGTWERVDRRLEEYAGVWRQAHLDACRAHEAREQSSDLFDRRMGCLARHKAELGALAEILADADRKTALRAAQASASLGRVEGCSDAERLMSAMPLPEDPAAELEIAQLREGLGRLAALDVAGKYDEALDITDALLERARTIDYPPIVVELRRRQGFLAFRAGKHELSQEALAEAVWLGIETGHDGEAARALSGVMFAAANLAGDHEAALRHEPLAMALARRVGEPDILPAVENSIGVAHQGAGDYERALEFLLRSIDGLRAAYGPDDHRVSSAYLNTATTLGDLGRTDEAIEMQLRALEIREREFGPEHPAVGMVLGNLGNSHVDQGDAASARVAFVRSVGTIEAAMGADHPYLVTGHLGLGNLEKAVGKFEEARDHYEQALRICEAAYGFEHRVTLIVVSNLANLHDVQSHWEAANRYRERETTGWEAISGPESKPVASALRAWALTKINEGRLEEAATLHERARSILEPLEDRGGNVWAQLRSDVGRRLEASGDLEGARAAYDEAASLIMASGERHTGGHVLHLRRGRVARRLGALEQSRAHLEAALEEWPAIPPSLGQRGHARFELAQTLRAIEDRSERANELARRASEDYAAMGPAWTEHRAAAADFATD